LSPMTKLKIWHFEHKGIADGKKFEKDFTADVAYIVRGILIKRTDGAGFTASDVTIRIAGDPLTRDKALCNTFGTDRLNYWPLEEDLPAKEKVEWAGYNREGKTLDIVVELMLEKKA